MYSLNSKKEFIQLNKENSPFMDMENMPDKVEENHRNFVLGGGGAVEVTTAIELHNKWFQNLDG